MQITLRPSSALETKTDARALACRFGSGPRQYSLERLATFAHCTRSRRRNFGGRAAHKAGEAARDTRWKRNGQLHEGHGGWKCKRVRRRPLLFEPRFLGASKRIGSVKMYFRGSRMPQRLGLIARLCCKSVRQFGRMTLRTIRRGCSCAPPYGQAH